MTTNPSYEPSYYGGVGKTVIPSKGNMKQPYRCPVHRQKQRDIDNDHPPDQRANIQRDHPTHKTKQDEPSYHNHCHFCHRDSPINPYWVPNHNPYYFPSRNMFQPAFMPGMYPPDQPYMRTQPYNMYDPIDMYNPRYPPGPGGYFMPTTGHPRSAQHKHTEKKKSIGFQDEVEEEYFDPGEVDPYLIEEAQKSKLKVRLALLIVLLILLIASVVLGAVATAMEPWLLQEKTSGTTTFESVKVGLWSSCSRPDDTKTWTCHKYSEKGKESAYENITLLQWCMVVGTVSVCIALVLVIVTIIVRKSRHVRVLLFIMIFFTIGATVLFGLVIGYVNEDDKAKQLAGKWITESLTNLKTSIMFAIGCAVTATSGMALILCCVMAFIYEPYRNSVQESIEFENINHSTGKGDSRIERKSTKSPQRGETRYHPNDGRTRNAKLNSDPALIIRGKEGLEKTNPVEWEHEDDPHQSEKTHNKDELPESGQPVVNEMKPRDNYPLDGVDSNDYQNGMAARPEKPKQVKGGPPSYFKRSPGNRTATMINPNSIMKSPTGIKHQVNKPDSTKEIAIYEGDYNTYFDEPY